MSIKTWIDLNMHFLYRVWWVGIARWVTVPTTHWCVFILEGRLKMNKCGTAACRERWGLRLPQQQTGVSFPKPGAHRRPQRAGKRQAFSKHFLFTKMIRGGLLNLWSLLSDPPPAQGFHSHRLVGTFKDGWVSSCGFSSPCTKNSIASCLKLDSEALSLELLL